MLPQFELLTILPIIVLMASCTNSDSLDVEIYETSESGNKLTKLEALSEADNPIKVTINPEKTFQEITGIGGSFTEASAYLLNELSEENRNDILEAYFGESGAKYSLTRTHMNSSDFSLGNYSYAPVPGDRNLENFSIEEDRDDLIPMIKDAMKISQDGFKIISSPWTAPPWMKDNNDWKGGKLLPEYYDTWALFFSKYLTAYKEEGIDIWGITVENEPLGNDSNWESMHFTPEEQNEFVKNHLGPQLENDGYADIKLLGYDQNRHEELIEWVDAMYDDEEAAQYYDGTAVHWYASTYKIFAEELQYAHQKAPNKHLIQTEATVDADIPAWKDDAWYWSKEATDWGWDWAPEDRKHLHPKYVPVFRYARDMIGTLNNWVDGWVDWNMVLNRQGGPNWAENWCVAPVIVDPDADEVYYTPLYYTMSHFSRYIRPGAVRIGHEISDDELMLTAAQNPDGSIAVVLLNQGEAQKGIELDLNGQKASFEIQGKAIQTVVIPASE
ncbi:glycoside hydrolase family 30 beta sandwich domain-containing protein [Gracilimonas sp.]|uniref:glycoside hydrolase family 30 protein n=1 Tax=Gracilimonas sp. TaxID=1974203 RepID=UPI002872089B|nr:glycoside hydrolase family 30 protein [Gracilimonas sp.]